jgi:hypothetical protein
VENRNEEYVIAIAISALVGRVEPSWRSYVTTERYLYLGSTEMSMCVAQKEPCISTK